MRRSLVVLLVALAGCAHSPLSAAALDETRLIAFIARIEDEAGPKSNVFRNDASYRDRLKRLDDKEADRRLGNALTVGSYGRNKDRSGKETGEPVLQAPTISRFEIADSLRSMTLALLPKQAPWSQVVHPVEVARVLESFLVQEVPANAPDYERLEALGADTVVEIVVEEYGMRSEKGKAGAYLVGHARMFRVKGPELYHRRFYSDDLSAGLEPLDPFAVRKDAQLFAARIKQQVAGIAAQIAKDLTPESRREASPKPGDDTDKPRQNETPQAPQADDPL
ncbi:MAG: hypothetical protein ACOZQL_24100 [Myxococcota bacterium]